MNPNAVSPHWKDGDKRESLVMRVIKADAKELRRPLQWVKE